MWLKSIFSVIQVLRSNDSPRQLAWGFAFGTVLGLIPVKSLFNILPLFLIYILNVNMGIALIAAALYKIFGVFLSRLFHHVGLYLLTQVPGLTSFWTHMYNLPIVPWTKFNNTVVLGSLVVSVVFIIPHYFVISKLLKQYQTKWRDKLEKVISKWAVVKWFQRSFLYKTITGWLDKYNSVSEVIGK